MAAALTIGEIPWIILKNGIPYTNSWERKRDIEGHYSMYEIVSGVVIAIIGLALLVPSIFNIKRRHDQANSPFLWIFLIAGLILSSFGILLVVLYWIKMGAA
jgi:protein-S-isoprenylcysteine O-methyltransferase Ste14